MYVALIYKFSFAVGIALALCIAHESSGNIVCVVHVYVGIRNNLIVCVFFQHLLQF